jgi:nitroreductase / dihydropteridine reductase
MNTIQYLNWRYATKRMNGSKVSEEKLEYILEAIRLSPSSLGLQPYTILVIADEKERQRIRPAINDQPQVTEASHVLVFAAWENYSDDRIDQYIQNVSQTRNESTESLAAFRNRIKASISRRSPEQLLAWNQRQTYIALGMGLVAAAEVGVDATPMEGFDPEALDKALGLRDIGLRSTLVMTLGYRDEANDVLSKKAKVRRPKKELFWILG